MTIVSITLTASAGLMIIAIAAVSWRLVRGPSLSDRVIALDMLGLLAVAVAALTAAFTGHRSFLDVAFGFALLGFLTAVAFAGLLERTPAEEDGAKEEALP